MSRYLIDQIEAIPNIETRVLTEVEAVHGELSLEAVTTRDREGRRERIEASAVFVFIGASPNTDWLAGVVARDPQGFVLTGADVLLPGTRPAWAEERQPYPLETSLPGVFAAGDVRSQSIKRVASGVGDGAMAVQLVHGYLGSRG
jgi:thioredoxin reductase (NADPH)